LKHAKGEEKTDMADMTLTCRECGSTFVFTEGEQVFFAQKGFSEPTRCPSCRAAKKAARNSGGDYGDSYGSGGYSGGGSYSSYGGGGGYNRPERTMTQVTCANCGKETEVPFVPRGDRPVYCSDCFQTVGGGGNRSRNRY
jgi:CxxC-x17-CxxC domain-containing protein